MSHPDPIGEFQALYEKALKAVPHDPDAMALATATPDGRPSVRMVLFKRVTDAGFVFFTNYRSRKAREIEANPRAALCIYWAELGRQVRVEGPVERIPEAESDAYFETRSRGSRIGAWASRQSEPLENRGTLLARVAKFTAKFLGRPVPRPEFWGGYRLEPERIEFWDHRRYRLHDRRRYDRTADGWEETRIWP